MNEIITGDCLEVLPELPADSVDLVVTSPPYPGQRGDRRTTSDWLRWFDVVLFRLGQALKPAGVLALNVMFRRRDGWFDSRLLTDIPELLQLNSFYLIDVYIYGKLNPAPNGNLDRHDPPGWEPIFVASRSEGYCFEPYREPYKAKSLAGDGTVYTTRADGVSPHPGGARQTNLMMLSSSGDQNRPKAKGMSFPAALPERFIRQHTQHSDVVLDPFCGVGTTCKEAQRLGRQWIGIEIDEAEAEKARQWLAEPYTLPLPV